MLRFCTSSVRALRDRKRSRTEKMLQEKNLRKKSKKQGERKCRLSTRDLAYLLTAASLSSYARTILISTLRTKSALVPRSG